MGQRTHGRTFQFFLVFTMGVVTAMLFFLPNMIMNGGMLLLKADYIQQQIPFYLEGRRMILSGSPLWSWNTELGVNFIGAYSFYLLGSPFFWISLIFSEGAIPYILGLMLIVKIGLCTVTAFLYIKLFIKDWKNAAVGALLYAFSGNLIVALPFSHFHEAFILFPLLLYSLEKAVKDDKRIWFSVLVALNALGNYYLFAGQTIFLILYFSVRLYSSDWRSLSSKTFVFLGLEYLLGLLLSSVLLLPTFYMLKENPRAVQGISFSSALLYSYEDYFNIISALFLPPISFETSTLYGNGWTSTAFLLPMMGISGVFTFILNKRNRKSWITRLLLICAIMSLVPILNTLFIGLRSDVYYHRWWYMAALIAALASAKTVSEADLTVKKRGIIYNVIITICFLSVPVLNYLFSLYNQKLSIFNTQSDGTNFIYFYAATTLCVVCSCLLQLPGMGLVKIRSLSATTVSILTIIIYSAVNGNFFIFLHNRFSNNEEYFNSRNIEFYKRLLESQAVNISEDNKNFYRVAYTPDLLNFSMVTGRPGIMGFHSIMEASSIKFGEFLGYRNSVSVSSILPYQSSALKALLSVKWILNTSSDIIKLKDDGLEFASGFDNLKIYENLDYIPMGIAYDTYIDADSLPHNTPDVDRMMLKGILLYSDGIERNKDIMKPVSINSMSFSDEALHSDILQRRKECCREVKTSTSGFEGKISLKEGKMVFFSVPFDKGWSASVNGKPVAIEKANIGFMAIRVLYGESIIKFNYHTPGLKPGVILSWLGFLFLIMDKIFSFYIIGK